MQFYLTSLGHTIKAIQFNLANSSIIRIISQLASTFILHWMWLYQETSPVVFDFKPQSVACVDKVPSTCLNEEPILDLALEQELVQDLILLVLTQSLVTLYQLQLREGCQGFC